MAVGMNFKENLSVALQSIAGNKLRASLTALIIAIGIMALVSILTAIEGIRQYTNEAFSSMGANSFSIGNRGSGIKFGPGRDKVYKAISYDDVMRFKEAFTFPATVSTSTTATYNATVKYLEQKTNPNVQIMGADDHYLQTAGFKLAMGRNFSANELNDGSPVVIIADEIRTKLFKTQNPIDQIIYIGAGRYRVIGLLASKGSSAGFGGDRLCIIPVFKAKQIISGKPTYTISVMVNSAGMIDECEGEARVTFRNVRHLPLSRDDNFEITRSDSVQQQLSGQLAFITIAGLVISMITLLGASIGLMNIMLVSVTERTREIGIRKAIGATPAIIRKQFWIEAIVICFIGGLGGIVLGMAAGNLIAVNISGSFVVPWFWLFAALIICTVIGLLSGYYPAKKASRLDPVEALRYE